MVILDDLKRHAVTASLFPATTLRRAIQKLRFVQADPIRSPARAQDLILRHRVSDYQEGDLDRNYRALKLEEDLLYAYGFMPLSTWQLLHPRGQRQLTAEEQKVLEIVSRSRRIHPKDLEAHLGRDREVNAWGGYSKATTRCLERLHFLGLLRISGRANGIRLYERFLPRYEPLGLEDRLRKLILVVANLLCPIAENRLLPTVRHLKPVAPDLTASRSALTHLLASGQLRSAEVDGLRYFWPAGKLLREEPEETVRFLAPFDPLVWDRQRFEHFWGWPYRFEAYTPAAKRKLGYYAMPLLWKTNVVGWVNASRRQDKLLIEPGFVEGRPPQSKSFRIAFEAEAEKLQRFLRPVKEITG